MSIRREVRRCGDTFREEYADNMCRVGEVLLSFTSGILTLVTFGTGFWLLAKRHTVEGVVYHLGLWQNCTISVCENISLSGPGYLISARIFMSLALIACLLSWVFSIIGLLHHRHQWLFVATFTYTLQGISRARAVMYQTRTATGILRSVTTISLIIGLISFSPSLKQTDDGVVVSPGWSYGVGWLSMVLSSACALYFVSVGWYRFRKPTPSHFPSESRSYAPLAQFESTDTGSDDNYDGD